MPDKPTMHGADHRPGGLDPIQPGAWHYVATSGSAWNGSTNYSPGTQVSHDVYLYMCVIPNTNVEPNVNSRWAAYWYVDQPLFQNSWVNSSASDLIPVPVPMRYRLSVGAANMLDKFTGSITTYSEHEVEIEGDIENGADNTTVFWLPPAFRKDKDIPIHAHDDFLYYIAGRVFSDGHFVLGTA